MPEPKWKRSRGVIAGHALRVHAREIAMRRIEDILELAKRLSTDERRELLRELEDLTEGPAEQSTPAGGRYVRTLAAAGTGHSEFTDVSSDKRPAGRSPAA